MPTASHAQSPHLNSADELGVTSGNAKAERADRAMDWDKHFTTLPTGERRPRIVEVLAHGSVPRLVWRNETGGQTWQIGDRYLKWSPDANGDELHQEANRLRWLHGRYPVPRVLDEGGDPEGHWLLTAAVLAGSAVDDQWRADPERAVLAIAHGLRRLHALPTDDFPCGWDSWATKESVALGPRPVVETPVLVHGDACVPNTLLDTAGCFVAVVDVGALALADRWADLAVASMSLEWNYGPGWDNLFFKTYGIPQDPIRIAYYRALYETQNSADIGLED